MNNPAKATIFNRVNPWLKAIAWLLPFAWLWSVLINHLRVEWSVNPQYAYGWAVPFLCALLLWRRIQFSAQVSGLEVANCQLPTANCQLPSTPSNQHPASHFSFQLSKFQLFALALCAFLYLPTRLIQEANPDWRLVSWALALEVIGITLCLLPLALPTLSRRSHNEGGSILHPQSSIFVFPLLFFLVSVPWPTLVEYPIIQALTRFDVSTTCELVGWLGIPAIPHGNVIQVATGEVGIDEACSGIRSFQATLMISLFVGEYYALSRGRRIFCVLAGFSLAVLLNLVRQIVLVWVAAKQGVPAIAKWHDPTGVIILLGCFFALWGIGVWLAGKKSTANCQLPTANSPLPAPVSTFRFPLSAFVILSAWLLFVEIGVEGWYRYHEARLPAPVTWKVDWPTKTPSFKELPFAPNTRNLLRYTEAFQASWQEDGLTWQVSFLCWKPGAIAQRLAGQHTPQTCLGASGNSFVGGTEVEQLFVHNLKMPFRFYRITNTPQPVFVAYCLWDDRSETRSFHATRLTHAWRLPPVLAGQRNPGQRVIEIGLTGVNDQAAAQAAVQKLLEKIIVPHAP